MIEQRLWSIPAVRDSGLERSDPPTSAAEKPAGGEKPAHSKRPTANTVQPSRIDHGQGSKPPPGHPGKLERSLTRLKSMSGKSMSRIAPALARAPATLKVGPMKDGVRLHEKACDDYLTRFSDGECHRIPTSAPCPMPEP